MTDNNRTVLDFEIKTRKKTLYKNNTLKYKQIYSLDFRNKRILLAKIYCSAPTKNHLLRAATATFRTKRL